MCQTNTQSDVNPDLQFSEAELDLVVAALNFAHQQRRRFQLDLVQQGHQDTAESASNDALDQLRIKMTTAYHLAMEGNLVFVSVDLHDHA
jgi:hypothetical protein